MDETTEIHNDAEWRCKRCNHMSSSKCNLLKHLRRKAPCNTTHDSISIIEYINDLIKKEYNEKTYDCNFCGAKFNAYQNRHRHYKTCKKAKKQDEDLQEDKVLTNDEVFLPSSENNMVEQLNTFKSLCVHLKEQMSQLQKELVEVKNSSVSQASPPEHPHKIGYIYLIREREFVNSNQNVFKVGRTIKKTPTCYLERLKDYKRGSQMLSVLHVNCDDCEHIEMKVKDVFNKMFKRHNDGHEYFEGDPKTMSMVINDVYADYYRTHTPIIDNLNES
jgi:hypothetical protein